MFDVFDSSEDSSNMRGLIDKHIADLSVYDIKSEWAIVITWMGAAQPLNADFGNDVKVCTIYSKHTI